MTYKDQSVWVLHHYYFDEGPSPWHKYWAVDMKKPIGCEEPMGQNEKVIQYV